MKIIYLHQYFKLPNENGGTRSFDLANSFVKQGLNVEVVTTSSEQKDFVAGKRWRKENVSGIIVHYLYLPYDNSFSFTKRAWVFFLFLWYSSIKLLKLKGDVVLATSTPLTIGIPALLKKIFHGTPYIFEVRDVWPEAVIAIGAIKNKILIRLLYQLEKIIYRNASSIVPLSVDMKKSIDRRYPQFVPKTGIVIPNISEIGRFQSTIERINLKDRLGFAPRFSVLYAGTFGKVNGIHKIVELAEKTLKVDQELVFILVGSGAEKKAVISLASQKGLLNKNIFVFDAITKDELPNWYNSVSMGSSFVIDIKELWANSANKFFDTLAANKPILINHEGWQADVIREQEAGYVLPPKITNTVATEFVLYTQDDKLIEQQGKNALKLAEKEYSLDVAVSNYLSLFKKIKNV